MMKHPRLTSNTMSRRDHAARGLRLLAMLCGMLGLAVAAGTGRADEPAAAETPAEGTVHFNRDVRPILSDKCFQCHGPDANQRQADLRLDQQASVFDARDGYSIVVPGSEADSELVQRITSSDPDYRMPPPDATRQLTDEERDTLRRWVKQGAPWQGHWSFVPPERPPLPEVQDADWPRTPIDRFILAALEQRSWKPSPPADAATLARRVSLDLTGLPPDPDLVAPYLANPEDAEYEKLVDRLLESPAYGERMAAIWMDAARYADTSGYQNDGPRYMWRWRDWVIEAYNRNTPFDQFTVEQLAGDMLPDPTLDQRIATGFNRNHRGNAEGGIIPEEYAVEYVVDRVETTSTVWLGLTIGCARCHDHKFDPVSQVEFYQLYSYFNNLPEHGRAIKEGNSPPYILAPTREQQQTLQRLDADLADIRSRLEVTESAFQQSLREWEKTVAGAAGPSDIADELPREHLVARFSMDQTLENLVPQAAPVEDADAGEDSPTAENPAAETPAAENPAARIETIGDIRYGTPLLPTGQALELTGEAEVAVGDLADFGYFDEFTISTWIKPDTQRGTILSRMDDDARAGGYYIRLEGGRIQVNLVKRWLDDAIRVETRQVLKPGCWYHLAVRYDGSRVARGITVSINGEPVPLRVQLDAINQTFSAAAPLRIGSGGGDDYHFDGSIDEVRIYSRALDSKAVAILSVPHSVSQILRIPAGQRTEAQVLKLRRYYLRHHAAAEYQALERRHRELVEAKKQFLASVPTVMVMEELPEPRPAYVLLRGQYDQPQEPVEPGLPESLLTSDGLAVPTNRLELARWLVSDTNPLTARVAVNRLWQQLFGIGLVKTQEDFGSQGESPSHPELLDWLAVEYRESGWDTKAMLKKIVMSSVYRQSSQRSSRLVELGVLEQDPENRLLARGPRIRLSAQMVRDQALAASGLLVHKLGGPSVRPYQPAGLWKEIATDGNYDQSTGGDLYRRSLYTYWKRTVAPPNMVAFDATARETCVVRTTRTNTPLQALTLMNDVTHVEAARALAQRVLAEADSDAARLRRAFLLLLVREPSQREQDILLGALNFHRDDFQHDPEAARELLAVGDSPVPAGLSTAELAAWTMVTTTLLNLDETVTRQ